MNPTRAPGLPVELRLAGREVLLLGPKAESRRTALEACGARVRTDGDVAGASLVLVTGGLAPADATRLRAVCRAAGALLWIEDTPDASDVTFPALLEAGPVRLAVSTGGRSSALARAVRDALRPLLEGAFTTWAQRSLAHGVPRPQGAFLGRFVPEVPAETPPGDTHSAPHEPGNAADIKG